MKTNIPERIVLPFGPISVLCWPCSLHVWLQTGRIKSSHGPSQPLTYGCFPSAHVCS
ncbi:hypothetical protein Hanom_Chr10g00891001 [Helianthus anomalus]